MLADDAVPVGGVLGVKDGFDVLGNILFCIFPIHDKVDLLLELALHLFVHLADDIVDYSIRTHRRYSLL